MLRRLNSTFLLPSRPAVELRGGSAPEVDWMSRDGVASRVGPIGQLAAAQQGQVARRQLLGFGVDARTVKEWVRVGRLHPVRRGVYAWGHPSLTPLAPYMAAVLACGEGAMLSHRSAAEVLGLLPARPGPMHVRVPTTTGRARDGIRFHRGTVEGPVTTEGIPTTTPARTIVDLSATEQESVVERALNEAFVQRRATAAQVLALVDGRPCRGKAVLGRLLAAAQGPQVSRSEAEQRARQLIRRAGLPQPRTNQRLLEYEVDFLWPDRRFVLEVDGYAFHTTRRAFERDREKDATLIASGYTVARVTWRQLTETPEAVVARLGRALLG